MEEKYIEQRDPIIAYRIRCPYCGNRIETRNAENLDVLDEGIAGNIEWYCDTCGADGYGCFFAEYSDYGIEDWDGNRLCTISREDSPVTSGNRRVPAKKPSSKKTSTARKTTPARKPAAKKAPARKPATRRKTTGARR